MAGDPICDLPSSLESAIVSWQKLVPGEVYQGKHKWPVSSKWPGLIPQNGCHLTLERSRKTPKWVTRKNLGGRNVVIFWWDETSWNVMWKTNGDLFPSFLARWWAILVEFSTCFPRTQPKRISSGYHLKFIAPWGSMYGIFPYIYHKNQLNVGKYTIHGSSGIYSWMSEGPLPLWLMTYKMGPNRYQMELYKPPISSVYESA